MFQKVINKNDCVKKQDDNPLTAPTPSPEFVNSQLVRGEKVTNGLSLKATDIFLFIFFKKESVVSNM